MTTTELNIGGKTTVELRGDELYAKAKTGNKHWVAVIEDTHPKYNYDREFAMYQKPKTSDRDKGTAPIADGAVIEYVRYTHSGKNRSDTYYQLVDGEAYQIDEADVEAALEGEIIPDVGPDQETVDELTEVDGVGEARAEALAEAGFENAEDVENADTDELEAVDGIGPATAKTITGDEDTDDASATVDETTDTAIAADGGLEVRDYRGDLERSDDLVRSYTTPPGERLYAYREGDHHIVVSRGKEPADRWETRVPAERDRLVPGEQLWTIPDNWELRVRDSRDDHAMGLFYNDETDTWARISIPTNNWLTDAWYGVSAVGDLDVEPAGNLGSSYDVRQYADEYEQQHEGDEVAEDAEAFRAIASGWDEVEEELRMTLEWVRDEGLEQQRTADQPLSTSDWELEFHQARIFRANDALERAADLSEFEIPTSEIVEQLRRADLLPGYYRFKLGLDGSAIDMDYYVRGLIEAGCSPPEALDYHMVEIAGLTQSEWADERGISQPSVSGNIKDAKRLLKK